MTRAMLLCAGFGTRLGPIGEQRPKPLLPVCGYPILRYGIANLVGHGITDIVINLHHRGELIRDTLGDGSAFGANIQYIEETDILGTGGGLKNALPLLDPGGTDEPFVSMNGKLIFDLDIGALLAAFAEQPDALGMMVVRKVPDALEWGAVDVSEKDGRYRVDNVLGAGRYMFCGVHATRPSVMRRLPDGEACSIRQGYLPWLKDGELVAAHPIDPNLYFSEHSTPARYLQASFDLMGPPRLTNPPGPLRGIDPTAHIASTATLRHPVKIEAGARIGDNATVGPNAVLAERAIVDANVTLERAVVWPRCRVSESASDVVVTPAGAISTVDIAAND